MGSSDLDSGLETWLVTGLGDPELAYNPSLGPDPNWVSLNNAENMCHLDLYLMLYI